MKEISLTASAREGTGKGPSRRIRMSGYIPGVVYGPDVAPLSVVVDERLFRSAMKTATRSSIFALDVDGKQNKVVLREIQRDPITSRVVHLDFHAISMTKPIHIAVPITLVGTPRGVKTDGGIMQTTLRELEVSCLPDNIPDHVEVDVTDLGIGDSIHVSDLKVPGLTVLSELRQTIVVISAPTVVKSAAAEAEEAAAAAALEGEEAPTEGGEAEGEEESKSDK